MGKDISFVGILFCISDHLTAPLALPAREQMPESKTKHIPVDLPWWENLVKMTDGRILITKGFANLSLEAPGLGIKLNNEVVKQYLHTADKSYFEPTPQWNDKRSQDEKLKLKRPGWVAE